MAGDEIVEKLSSKSGFQVERVGVVDGLEAWGKCDFYQSLPVKCESQRVRMHFNRHVAPGTCSSHNARHPMHTYSTDVCGSENPLAAASWGKRKKSKYFPSIGWFVIV